MGRWTPVDEIDERLAIKVTKMIGQVGAKALETLGKTRKSFRAEIEQRFKTGRVYVLDPHKVYGPPSAGQLPVGAAAVAAG